ncbi:VOC family protein [Algoriphagus pacificus]|uniref:Aldoketomutase n=1 Tax=Algoriphagus pacificus TaxID=2811234 RepID=A0ABS3CBY2_9BACT|nr:VOC family protein [Algoriphagus pacificus]MBN7814618.1 VOC family protein [Algoriphagus pacificus]
MKTLNLSIRRRILSLLALIGLFGCQSNPVSSPNTPQFNHVYLHVSDMDRSLDFYTSAFDLEVTKHIKKLKRTSEDGQTLEQEINLALLKFPGHYFGLEIGETLDSLPNNTRASYAHVGIEVEDIESASERIIKAGGLSTRPITQVETESIQAKTAFFTGPDGETIELMQIISGSF